MRVLADRLRLRAFAGGELPEAGAEVGRQPWVVYRVMRTSQAVTGARGIPVGYGTLVLVYVLLIAAVAWVLWRLARKPLELEPSLSAAEVD